MVYLLMLFSLNAFSTTETFSEKGIYFSDSYIKAEDYCYFFDGKMRFCVKEEHGKLLKRIEKLEKECKVAKKESEQ